MAEARRTLVREVLFSQLIFAAFVGLTALGCVWWVSNWVVRDNLDDWAVRWVGEADALGSGLLVDPADDGFLELERYLSRLSEIEYVRYYDRDGEIAYFESALEDPALYPALTGEEFERLANAVETAQHHLKEMTLEPLVRISKAVVRESIVSANLFEAESLAELESQTTVVGYVELGLDYSAYDRDLLAGVSTATTFMVLAFLGLMLAGRLALLKAIRPLSDMQQPLDRIAQGDLDVEVPASSHREVAAVGDALRTAVAHIRERDRHLSKLANFDPLTGLPSRYHFMELLKEHLQAAGNSSDGAMINPGALVFLDLDQFKHVNDTLGHQAGDQALCQVAQRLQQMVRRDDLVGRFGGDEFVLFIPEISLSDAESIGQKLLNDLSEFPLMCGGVSLNANCSLGVAMAEESSALNPEELISHADMACRLAKSQGRNRVCFYEPDQQQIESIRNDVEWQRKLKEALKQKPSQPGRLELHYQPILGLSDGEVCRYEVLVRLREGERLFLPNQFLPAAIRFGLMADIDRWVIDRSLAELAAVRRQREIRFSINVAGSAFVGGSLAAFVRSRLEKHKVPAKAVMFEITEQVAIGSFSEAVPQIRELRAMGCEFAVDDFGTGYNSLSYLKRLPVQYIKIDGSFISRLAVNRVDQTIVRSIADIARIMGKRTIAEFVGDERTLELIREMGIDYAQGYFIGKPLPAIQSPADESKIVRLDSRRSTGSSGGS
jgi:diguanylate cyclase (GGDEF)-like protein